MWATATISLFIPQNQIVSSRKFWKLTHEAYRLRVSETSVGSRKMKVYLSRKSISIKRKRIQRLIRLVGLKSVTPKPNNGRQCKWHKVYPFLLKKMSITEPDQVWCSDITYILLVHGFVYLTALMDWGSLMCCPGKYLWPWIMTSLLMTLRVPCANIRHLRV